MIESWERGKDGEVLPQEIVFVPAGEEYEKEIERFKQLSLKAEGNREKEVYEEAAKELRKQLENIEPFTMRFTPLLNYELRNIYKPEVKGKSIGCEGLPVEDSNADILANHCVKPKKTYEDWKHVKDFKLKKALTKKIIEQSLPRTSEASVGDDVKKKVLKKLQDLQRKGEK